MGWGLGWDSKWNRDIGYNVPAYCDHPKCTAEIDRGLGHVCCDSQPHGGERGCGLYFCAEHAGIDGRCKSCASYRKTDYKPKPEHPDWITHKLTDESWQPWRDENPDAVQQLKEMAT